MRTSPAAALPALLFSCTGVIDAGERPGDPGAPGGLPAATGGRSTPGPGAIASATGTCGYMPRRAWRLTPSQLRRSYAAVLGTAAPGADFESILDGTTPDARPFSNAEPVLSTSLGFMEAIVTGLRPAAASAAANLPALHPCFGAGVTRACMTSFLKEVGARAWRRAWTDEEVQSYLTFYDAASAKSDPKKGVELVLRRMLAAPDFLYRFELGGAPDRNGLSVLTPDELASALAYLVTDGPPDAPLATAARAGTLQARTEIEAQGRRLLDKADSAVGLFNFLADLFDGTQTGHPDQPEELRRFVGQALWSDAGTLATLLTADYTLINPALQKFYGWTRLPVVKDWERVTAPAAEGRSGLLTQGLYLSRNTNRSARGKFVRELLLCTHVPEPPPNVDPTLDAQKAALTAKLGRPATEDEAREAHMLDPACASCHRLIDPLGKPLIAFDRQGVWLAQNPETKKPYDTASEILATGDLDGRVADVRALARALAGSRTAAECMVRHAFEFALGRAPTDADACHVKEAAARFASSGGDVRRLFLDLVASESFRVRGSARK